MTTSERIRAARRAANLTQEELADKIGVKYSAISKYENGRVCNLKRDTIAALAEALNVKPSWLMCMDDEPAFDIDNIYPIKTKRFPLLGNIACGEPIFAEEEHETYIEAGADIEADFCLKAKGDSMTGARILDGDIVFIHKQEIVDNGEIAAVLIGDEATLKRVYYDRANNLIQLFPENPAYPVMRYSGEELNQVRILGKAVAFYSNLRG